MPTFSATSQNLLSQVHPDLQTICNEVIKYMDFTVLDSTIRTLEQQKKFVAEGKSKTMNSKHLKRLIPELNKEYSCAVDIAPYFATVPHIDWNDSGSFYLLAGYVLGIASILYAQGKITHKVRYGGDWDGDKRTTDETFYDGPHFELII